MLRRTTQTKEFRHPANKRRTPNSGKKNPYEIPLSTSLSVHVLHIQSYTYTLRNMQAAAKEIIRQIYGARKLMSCNVFEYWEKRKTTNPLLHELSTRRILPSYTVFL